MFQQNMGSLQKNKVHHPGDELGRPLPIYDTVLGALPYDAMTLNFTSDGISISIRISHNVITIPDVLHFLHSSIGRMLGQFLLSQYFIGRCFQRGSFIADYKIIEQNLGETPRRARDLSFPFLTVWSTCSVEANSMKNPLGMDGSVSSSSWLAATSSEILLFFNLRSVCVMLVIP